MIKPPKPTAHANFQAQQMSRMAFNPIHEEHVTNAFKLHNPKIQKFKPETGSPWAAMKDKK